MAPASDRPRHSGILRRRPRPSPARLARLLEGGGCDDQTFAAAGQIPRLMAELEKGPLRQFTPCRFRSLDQMVRALAVVQTELMLIHPFRDGNGRVGRMLAILMALQARLPPLNFGSVRGRKRQQYFAAVRAGLERNYEPMERIFSAVIRRTLEISQARRL